MLPHDFRGAEEHFALTRAIASVAPAIAAATLLASPAFAATSEVSATGSLVTLKLDVKATPQQVYLDQFADPVDGVLTEQLQRLVSYVETGKPQ